MTRTPNISPRRVSLPLAGGNALGAYEGLHEAGYEIDLVTGASVCAVTAGVIAGNLPAQRVDKLREFWRQAAAGSALGLAPAEGKPRDIYNKMHAMQTFMMGRPGLFAPGPPTSCRCCPAHHRTLACSIPVPWSRRSSG